MKIVGHSETDGALWIVVMLWYGYVSAAGKDLRSEIVRIDSTTGGLKLALHHEFVPSPRGPKRRIVLFAEGSTVPTSGNAAYKIDGLSWMDDLAGHGFDVWSVDYLGLGDSSRYPDMTTGPKGTASECAEQLATAVRYILKQRRVDKLVVIGDSFGTLVAGVFATKSPELLDQPILFAPVTPVAQPNPADISLTRRILSNHLTALESFTTFADTETLRLCSSTAGRAIVFFLLNQVDVFSSQYRVVTLDLAGHGESGKDRKQWTILGLAQDVVAVVNDLQLKKIILIGHSMGGPVCLEAARQLQGRVGGVILVDTMHDISQRRTIATAQADAESLKEDFKGYFRDLSALFSKTSDPATRHWVEQQAMAAAPSAMIALKLDTPNIKPLELFVAAGVRIRAINAMPPLSDRTNLEEDQNMLTTMSSWCMMLATFFSWNGRESSTMT